MAPRACLRSSTPHARRTCIRRQGFDEPRRRAALHVRACTLRECACFGNALWPSWYSCRRVIRLLGRRGDARLDRCGFYGVPWWLLRRRTGGDANLFGGCATHGTSAISLIDERSDERRRPRHGRAWSWSRLVIRRTWTRCRPFIVVQWHKWWWFVWQLEWQREQEDTGVEAL